MEETFEPGRDIPEHHYDINQAQIALDDLSRIIQQMGIDAQVFYHEQDEFIFLEIHGNNLGLVIGRHGQTLDALEFIMNVVHRKRYPDSRQLILDAQGYREKKRSILKKILFSARDAVLSTNNEVPLDPMSPSDRKTIHMLCRDLTDVKSESRGEGNNRRVIILPAEDDDANYDSMIN